MRGSDQGYVSLQQDISLRYQNGLETAILTIGLVKGGHIIHVSQLVWHIPTSVITRKRNAKDVGKSALSDIGRWYKGLSCTGVLTSSAYSRKRLHGEEIGN